MGTPLAGALPDATVLLLLVFACSQARQVGALSVTTLSGDKLGKELMLREWKPLELSALCLGKQSRVLGRQHSHPGTAAGAGRVFSTYVLQSLQSSHPSVQEFSCCSSASCASRPTGDKMSQLPVHPSGQQTGTVLCFRTNLLGTCRNESSSSMLHARRWSLRVLVRDTS